MSIRVISLKELRSENISEVGGKAHSLGIFINNKLNVPQGFVINSSTFFKYLDQNNLKNKIAKLVSEINGQNSKNLSEKIRRLILKGNISKEIDFKIKRNLDKYKFKYACVRSSAVSEDSSRASFAGLYDTFLNIKAEGNKILEYTKKCWASLFNVRAVNYRIEKKISHLEGIAVIIQEMIPSEVSGITFTEHPFNPKALLIETSYGLGNYIAEGRVKPDYFVINRETLKIEEKMIGNKDKMSICKKEGVKTIYARESLRKKMAISDEKAREIAEICLRIEKMYNYKQDIEWCIYKNIIWLLQSRPITVNKMNLDFEED